MDSKFEETKDSWLRVKLQRSKSTKKQMPLVGTKFSDIGVVLALGKARETVDNSLSLVQGLKVWNLARVGNQP